MFKWVYKNEGYIENKSGKLVLIDRIILIGEFNMLSFYDTQRKGIQTIRLTQL